MNELYPIFLKVSQLHVLILGGGAVGLEKLGFLLKSSPSALVTVAALDICEEIHRLSENKNVTLVEKAYEPGLLEGKQIVVAATDDLQLNLSIQEDCKRRNILINVADNPDLCDFFMGSIVTKGNLKLAISTNGKSPTAAKRLRQFFEELFPDSMDDLLDNLNAYRNQIQGDFKSKVDKLNSLTKDLLKRGS